MSVMRLCASLVAVFLLAGASRVASAQELPTPPPPPRIESTWMHSDGAVVPAPLGTAVTSRFAATDATALFESGGAVGLTPRLSLLLLGVHDGFTGLSSMTGGLRLSLLPTTWVGIRAVLGAGYLREMSGGDGVWTSLALARDAGPLRLTMAGQVSYVTGPVVQATAGASYAVGQPFRLGLEYAASSRATPTAAKGHSIVPTVGGQSQDGKTSIMAGWPIVVSGRSLAPRVSVTHLF